MLTVAPEANTSPRATEEMLRSALNIDKHLSYFGPVITARYEYFLKVLREIVTSEGSLEKFSRGYEKMGFVVDAEGITYREWAPGTVAASLIGDFSNDFFTTRSSRLTPAL